MESHEEEITDNKISPHVGKDWAVDTAKFLNNFPEEIVKGVDRFYGCKGFAFVGVYPVHPEMLDLTKKKYEAIMSDYFILENNEQKEELINGLENLIREIKENII